MDKTREPDIKVVEQGLKSRDPNVQRVAMNAGNEIRKQSTDSRLKRRRQKLLHEIRQGKEGNAREIRNSMIKDQGGKLSVGIIVNAKDHERIWGKKDE